MSGADPAPGEGKGDGARERLRAPLARLGWQAYESLLYLLDNAVVVLLHLGLMMVASLAGVAMRRLVVGVVVGAEEESRLAVVTGAATDAAVVLVAFFIAVLGLLSVAMRVWRDFRNRL